MEFEWTERLLNIPRAVAADYARPGTYAYEELVSDGNLALVEAAADYDPGCADPAGSGGFAAFACQRVRWALLASSGVYSRGFLDHRARWSRLFRLSDVSGLAVESATSQPWHRIEIEDEVRRVRESVPVEQFQAMLLMAEGNTSDEVGTMLGVPAWRVRYLVGLARKKMQEQEREEGCER